MLPIKPACARDLRKSGLLFGFGVAMFHPPAGRDARLAAGGSATAMSYFAAGGSAVLFLRRPLRLRG